MQSGGEQVQVDISGELGAAAATRLLRETDAGLAGGPERLVLDLSEVKGFDSTGIGGLVEAMRRARLRQVDVRLRGAPPNMLEFLSLVSVDRLLEPPPPAMRGGSMVDWLARLGARAEPGLGAAAMVLRTAWRTAAVLAGALLRPRRMRLDRVAVELDSAAIGALPVVLLIAFLLGLVLAMQAWVQLRLWGAEIYMADMVGVSVLTEIGPLMTAIVLAARSGSSNAAQLGSMKVSEELDALQQMAVQPLRFLVVPKVVALAIASAALALVFDVVAMSGGALFGWLKAGIELEAYREQTRQALQLADVLVALAKSVTFGCVVGVVGCAFGLRVEGGSNGVARATTSAVVFSVFAIIILDAAFVTVQRLVLV